MMGVSWGALAGSFLAPFLFGLYWKGASKAAVWVNFILAASFMTFVAINNVFELNILNKFADGFFASPINSGAIAMLAGFIIVPAVSAFTSKPEEKKVKEIMASVAKN
jgi:SSS family solute:Na+ symporter